VLAYRGPRPLRSPDGYAELLPSYSDADLGLPTSYLKCIFVYIWAWDWRRRHACRAPRRLLIDAYVTFHHLPVGASRVHCSERFCALFDWWQLGAQWSLYVPSSALCFVPLHLTFRAFLPGPQNKHRPFISLVVLNN
jgi:hypothetical protein